MPDYKSYSKLLLSFKPIPMHKVYLLLGSNLGDSAEQLKHAKGQITKLIGNITKESSFYSTAAWGNTSQPDFLNQIVVVTTTLTPELLLDTILQIEKDMGRVRNIKNDPRIIDIDIIFFAKKIIQKENLTIPHPLLQERNFVLVPLHELSPNFIHPVLKKTVHQLLKTCKDKLAVQKK